MRVTTSEAAKLLKVSISYSLRIAQALDYNLPRITTDRGACRMWSVRHIVGVLALPVLSRAKVSDASTEAVARMLGALASDEVLEAKCAEGKTWLFAFGAECVPVLGTREQVVKAAQQHSESISAAGLTMRAIDIGPLVVDVTAAVAKLREVPDAAQ
jgi:hypothetical protein